MPVDPSRTHFGSGPAGIPAAVLQAGASALLDFDSTGLGLAEHSHRSALAAAILEETKADLATFLGLDRSVWEVLFMQGGGSGQFAATAYFAVNTWVARRHRALLAAGKSEDEAVAALRDEVAGRHAPKLDYVVSGRWSEKAAQEAVTLFGEDRVNVAADSKEGSIWRTVPDEAAWKLSSPLPPAMVYYCDNETVEGVEFPSFPSKLLALAPSAGDDDGKSPAPLIVADMSSNILTRRIPLEHFSVIFFGAQKNLGITGVTVVLVRKCLLESGTPAPALLRELGLPAVPAILNYEITAKHNSLYNTLPILDVYICGRMLKHLLAAHANGIDGAEAWTNKKAALVYDAIAARPARYSVIPGRAFRSRTNICFRVVGPDGDADEEGTKAFLAGAEQRGMTGLKGHRSMGGLRVGNFNGVTEEGILKLLAWMDEFAKGGEVIIAK